MAKRYRQMKRAYSAGKAVYGAYKRRKMNYKTQYQKGVTGQHDSAFQYRKKRMPRYKRKQWKKFVKKVTAVNNKLLGTQTVLYNKQTSCTSATGEQNYTVCTLYGKDGDQSTAVNREGGGRDLRLLYDALGATQRGARILFKSGVLDVTLTNMSVDQGGVIPPIEADVYEVTYGYSSDDFTSVANAFNEAKSDTQLIGATQLTETTRGATLFDFPTMLSAGRVKIMSKRKYFIPARGCITYQVRDPKNHVFPLTHIDPTTAISSFIEPGMTRGIIVIHKPIAGYETLTSSLNAGITRKYSYVIMEDASPADGRLE